MVEAKAASYRSVFYEEVQQIGDIKIWRSANNEFTIIKKNGNVVKLNENCYAVSGITNGKKMYYTARMGKHGAEVKIYEYIINSGKKKFINTFIDVFLQGYYNNKLYLSNSKKVFSYNIKTKQIKYIDIDAHQIKKFQNNKIYFATGTDSLRRLAIYNVQTRKVKTVADRVSYVIDEHSNPNRIYFIQAIKNISPNLDSYRVAYCNAETGKKFYCSSSFIASSITGINIKRGYVIYIDKWGQERTQQIDME